MQSRVLLSEAKEVTVNTIVFDTWCHSQKFLGFFLKSSSTSTGTVHGPRSHKDQLSTRGRHCLVPAHVFVRECQSKLAVSRQRVLVRTWPWQSRMLMVFLCVRDVRKRQILLFRNFDLTLANNAYLKGKFDFSEKFRFRLDTVKLRF